MYTAGAGSIGSVTNAARAGFYFAQANPVTAFQRQRKLTSNERGATMSPAISRTLLCVAMVVGTAAALPPALRADDDSQQRQAEEQRRAAEERQRELDRYEREQRERADEWQRQQQEQQRNQQDEQQQHEQEQEEQKLSVCIVPHSHIDIGWLSTVEVITHH